jgi:hypothetical protein
MTAGRAAMRRGVRVGAGATLTAAAAVVVVRNLLRRRATTRWLRLSLARSAATKNRSPQSPGG